MTKKRKTKKKAGGLAKYRAKVKKATGAITRAIKKAESKIKQLRKKKAAKIRKIKF